MSSHRHTISVFVALTEAQVQQMKTDKSYRCMIYCATLEPITGFTRDTDIAFPHQVEVRVNEVAVTGLNLRGLKNKPGSTRPADITDRLKMIANYRNEISLTYAVTQKVCQLFGSSALVADGPEIGICIRRQLRQN
jgi:E3 SUMO-protein ligase PIAS1